MPSFNRLTIVGHLGRDPELKYTPQGGGLSFTADTLTVEFNAKGEKTAKLKGGAFAKFGVRLWPEVAAQLGFDLNQYQAGDYRIDPMSVAYVNNTEGKPSKITGRF